MGILPEARKIKKSAAGEKQLASTPEKVANRGAASIRDIFFSQLDIVSRENSRVFSGQFSEKMLHFFTPMEVGGWKKNPSVTYSDVTHILRRPLY